MPLWNLKDKSPRLNMKSLGNGQWCVISAVQVKYLITYLVAFHDVITNCDNISFRSCGIHAEELGGALLLNKRHLSGLGVLFEMLNVESFSVIEVRLLVTSEKGRIFAIRKSDTLKSTSN